MQEVESESEDSSSELVSDSILPLEILTVRRQTLGTSAQIQIQFSSTRSKSVFFTFNSDYTRTKALRATIALEIESYAPEAVSIAARHCQRASP